MTLAVNSPPRVRPFTRDEYYRMYNIGLFEGQRVELIKGEVITMSPQNNPHALACAIVTHWLAKSLGDTFTIRCQLPFVASDDTEPEPDFAVVAGAPETQREHPTTALLVIEIAGSSLAHDRKKADIYASCGVPEYWILNLADRQLDVFRDPAPSVESAFGHRYVVSVTLGLEQPVVPAQLPIPPIAVGKLFPALV